MKFEVLIARLFLFMIKKKLFENIGFWVRGVPEVPLVIPEFCPSNFFSNTMGYYI